MPSLIVAPALDARYRSADALGAEQARTLQARALARLTAYAEGYDVPVLVTRTAPDEFTEPIETAATHHLRCEQTRMGPRFVGEEFETLVYPVEGGSYYQTTFAYWREILETRASQLGLQPASPEPVADEDGIGHGTMADGTSTSLTADPMLDAWTAVSGTRG
nr:hypothetical protein [Natronobacterium texcoconense]